MVFSAVIREVLGPEAERLLHEQGLEWDRDLAFMFSEAREVLEVSTGPLHIERVTPPWSVARIQFQAGGDRRPQPVIAWASPVAKPSEVLPPPAGARPKSGPLPRLLYVYVHITRVHEGQVSPLKVISQIERTLLKFPFAKEAKDFTLSEIALGIANKDHGPRLTWMPASVRDAGSQCRRFMVDQVASLGPSMMAASAGTTRAVSLRRRSILRLPTSWQLLAKSASAFLLFRSLRMGRSRPGRSHALALKT